MEKNINRIALKIIVIAFLLVGTSSNLYEQQLEGLTVIANSGSTPSSISQKEFDKIIHGEQQRWQGGKTVSIALMNPSTQAGSQTAKSIFNMSGNQLNKYWLGLVFEGKSKGPEFFLGEEELIKYVSVTPGAVGVISATTKSSNVSKVIIVENK